MPVSTQAVAPLVSWEASQRAGCRGWGSKSAIANSTVYAYSISLRARGENLFQGLSIEYRHAPLGQLLKIGFPQALLDRWRQRPKSPLQQALKYFHRYLATPFLPTYSPTLYPSFSPTLFPAFA